MQAYLNILYIFCISLTFLLGISALHQDRKSKINQSFFLFSLNTIGWMAVLYFGFYFVTPETKHIAVIFFRLAFGFGAVFVFFLSRFIYIFPQKTYHYPKTVEYLFAAGALVIFLLSAFTPYMYEDIATILIERKSVEDVYGSLYLFFLLYILGNYIFEIYIAVKKIRNTQGIEKQKVILAFSGLFLFLFSAVMTNVILPLFGIIVFQREAALFSLFFIIPAFYSMQKHRFFNLSNTSLNLLRKLIIVSIFFLATFTIHQTLQFFFPHIDSLVSEFASAGIALGLVYKIANVFPEFLTAGFRQFRNVLVEFHTKLYSCNSYTELQNLLDTLFELELNIPNTKIFVLREKHVNTKVPVYVQDEFTAELQQIKDILVTEEMSLDKKSIIHTKRKKLLKKLQQLKAAICLPLFAERNLIGFFILGKKENSQSYAEEEIEELSKLRHPLEVCFMNILLRENMQEENNLMKAIVREKTDQLKKQMTQVQKLLKQQSDFIAVAAHEFRTPLSIALFQLQDTLESYKHLPKVLEDIKTVGNSLDNLKMLTQNLFDVQQYDLQKFSLHLTETPLVHFLQSIYTDFRLLMKEKSLQFSFQNKLRKEMKLRIDEQQMRRVLHNLLMNALKFTPEKGKINLSVEKKGRSFVIRVEDNGKNIPTKDRKRIFEKFQTINMAEGMGIGLGLYLCKKIVQLHKGKIWAEDTEGGGATFCVELPPL